jgi:hypothetical protein
MTVRMSLAALATMLCVACSTAVPGAPTPAQAIPNLPPRPREFRIDGLNPCNALTRDQLGTLDVRFYAAEPPRGNRGPGCDWIHSPTEPVESYTVNVNTHGGVELAFGTPDLDVTSVAGFAAVNVPALYSSGKSNCIVGVDVARGEALQVSYFYNGSTVPMTHELACQKARNAAALAMQTILAKVGG